MIKPKSSTDDLLLFDEAMPFDNLHSEQQFKSECPPDKKVNLSCCFLDANRLAKPQSS